MDSVQSLSLVKRPPSLLYRVLDWLIGVAGFLLWFPALSLVTVGNKVGIQPVLVVFMLFVAYWVMNRQKVSIMVILLTLLWTLALVLSTVFSTDMGQSVRGFLAYLSGLLVFFSAALIMRWEGASQQFIWGYTAGGVLSSIYAIYQYLVPRLGLPIDLYLLRNTTTFPLYLPSIYTPWRPFGFTAEPSHLAELLIPLSMLLMGQFWLFNKLRYALLLIVVTIALIALGSLSVIISLPVAFVAVVFFVPQLAHYRARIMKLLVVISISLLAAFALLSLYQTTVVNGQAVQPILGRYRNLSTDTSFIARSVSIQIAIDLFKEHPLTGVGLFAGAEEFIKRNPLPVALYGEMMGVPNRLLATLAEQGIVGLLVLLVVVGYAFYNTRRVPLLRTLVVTWFVIILFQGGNVFLYNGWAFLGFGCGIKSPRRLSYSGKSPKV